MSDVSDGAVVRLLIGDYAASGESGKINVLGAGISVLGWDQTTGVTNSFSVIAFVSFDPAHAGESPAIELLLQDAAGKAVQLPGPAGPLAEPQTMVVSQARPIEEPLFQGVNVPRKLIRPTFQIVLNFATGLPLPGGQLYTWRLKIDHDTSDAWTESFYVPAPAPGPVWGGSTGPADLPTPPA